MRKVDAVCFPNLLRKAGAHGDAGEVEEEYGLSIATTLPDAGAYDAVILTVPHEDMGAGGPSRLRAMLKPEGVLFDMKAAFGVNDSDLRL